MILHKEAFEVVKVEVKKLASSILTKAHLREEFELCYKGTVDAEAIKFPIMGLQLLGEPMLVVDNKGMFIQVNNNTFCLAVLRSPNLRIIGIMAQQGYNVRLDLEDSKIYFQKLDCQILEESKS
ncbi:hypothetical protein LINPERPRIM_LOCUS40698 [Linum perenne]